MFISSKLSLIILCVPALSIAQNQITIPKINGEIILDGLSNEQAWQNIQPFTYVKQRPIFGEVPSEKSGVLMAYDDEYLYVAGRLYDRDPQHIESYSKKRDSDDPNCQWFGIALDTYNDHENALAFFTTPAGLRWDAAIINDNQGNIIVDATWNTFWDVEVVTNEEGWFAEFRIPLSSLRFQDVDGKVTMGLISWRSIPRRNEYDIFPAIPPNWGGRSFYKISESREIMFDQMHSHNPVYLTPYISGGIQRSYKLNDAGNSYNQNDKRKAEAGLDLKYGIASNMTLDLTLNTDFAQVEADDQQINLTRFSLFFPEKRLFFQERSSIFSFDFETSDQNRLFYSRRIGISDGRLVPIYGGARLVGRVDNWDIGFLNMQTAPIEDLASENFCVLRLRKQLNPYSFIGAMTTSKINNIGGYNIAYGLDGTFNLLKDDYLTLKWAQTFQDKNVNNALSLDPSKLNLFVGRPNSKGFGYGFRYSYTGRDYNPGLGFELRENYQRYSCGLWYGFFPDKGSGLFRHQPTMSSIVFIRNIHGTIESASVIPEWQLETKSGHTLNIKTSFFYEDIPGDFSISQNIKIPMGKYYFSNVVITYGTPVLNKSLQASCSAGSFYDGKFASLEVSPKWNISSSIELNSTYQINYLIFEKQNQEIAIHIGRLRILYMLDTKFSILSFLQYNSNINTLLLNVRLRYNPREGVAFDLAYDETDNTNRFNLTPVPPFNSDRTLLLKYTYTFNL